MNFFENSPYAKLSAVCDFNREWTKHIVHDKKGVTAYYNYDKFLEHDLDIVVICGYCTEHAPQAIKALQSGKHVLSEVIACKTLAEGVQLCRAVERTTKKYMLAENYCYFSFNQEIERVYREGVIGEYFYGECEYVHDCLPIWHHLTDGRNHWRNWLPPTYYGTHSLGPIVKITDTRPIKVTGFIVPNRLSRSVGRYADDGGILICTMDNGAIVKILPWCNFPREPGSIWYCLYGTKGMIENNRCRDTDMVNLFVKGASGLKNYTPVFEIEKERALKTGHGGSDYFIGLHFVESILKDETPAIDVYKSMDMTLPGILGYRSALNGNIPLEVPDFRKESVREKYENDNWSPDPADKKIPGQPLPSVLGEIKIDDSVYKEISDMRKNALALEYAKAIKV